MVVIWAFVIRCLFCEETQLLMVWNKFWSSILIFENLYSYFRFHELLRNIETIPLYENWRHILTDAMRIMHNENATSEKISTNPIYPTLLFSSYIFMNISELSPHCNNFNFFKELCRPEKIEILETFHMDILKENIFIQNSICTELLKSIFFNITCKL